MELQKNVKIILHVDMNAFFCSVACLLNPSLRGQVFAVGRENSYRGVITSASYEARALGIRAAMSQKEAYDLVPNLHIVSIDMPTIKKYHHQFVAILQQYSSLVEVASVDEAFLDITELSAQRHPLVIAKEIQARILKEVGLSCSIGIAPTLYLAKMASDLKKPLGISVLRKRDVQKILYPLPVSDIYGIGKKTYPILLSNQILTISDFMDPQNKEKIIKLIGQTSYEYATTHLVGNSTNIVDPYRHSQSESISTSKTFERIVSTDTDVLYELRKMIRSLLIRMNKKKYYGKTITITMRNIDFKTINRSKTLDTYINDYQSIYDVVIELVEEHYHGEELRLLGVGISNLLPEEKIPREYNLFTIEDYDHRQEKINQMIQDFQKKYGKNALFQNKNK